MKKFFKKEIIISFIVGVILASSIAVYAYSYNANDIKYTDNKTVEQALNDLYSNKKETTDSIAEIKTNGEQSLDKYYKNLNVNVTKSIIKLQIAGYQYSKTQHTFNIGANYQEFNSLELNKNMFISIQQLRVASNAAVLANDMALSYSYDNTTGILTITDTKADNERIYLASSATSVINVYIIK